MVVLGKKYFCLWSVEFLEPLSRQLFLEQGEAKEPVAENRWLESGGWKAVVEKMGMAATRLDGVLPGPF